MGTFTRLIKATQGGPKDHLADFRHAARIFVDGTHRIAPRTKFLFYVFFEVDASAHQAAAFTATKGDKEMSLLVKRCELPRMTFDTVVKNQYNRKKIVYKQITYDPITFAFHDDNSGIMQSLYSLYYGYHSRDHFNKKADYSLGNQLLTKNYNMDVDIKVNLFKRVSIFTMSQQRFNEYQLLGPRIKNWSHGEVDYSAGADTVESSMTIEYEAVAYNTGKVSYGVPDGFASLSYDKVPSPHGGGGAGGGLGGLSSSLNNISAAMGSFPSVKNTLQKAASFATSASQAINSYQNVTRSISTIASNASSAISGISNAISGIQGAAFPRSVNNGVLSPTRASQKILGAPLSVPGSFNETFKGVGGKPPTST
jgi:hypothetical protein